jgi:hypothetical protein
MAIGNFFSSKYGDFCTFSFVAKKILCTIHTNVSLINSVMLLYGNCPQGDLAMFGYRPAMKVEICQNPFIT